MLFLKTLRTMPYHQSLINVLKVLGYISYDNYEGLCHGASIAWLESCFSDEEDIFNSWIYNFYHFDADVFATGLNTVKEKVKNKEALDTEEEELFQVPAFCQRIKIYQDPEECSELFNQIKAIPQIDIEFISQFASTEKIRALGGLTMVYSQPLMHTVLEIKNYLDRLVSFLQKNGFVSKDKLGFLLSSYSHTIALTYTKTKGWTLMNISSYPSKSFKQNQTRKLANNIFESLQKMNSPYLGFNLSIITTEKYRFLPQIKKALSQFKASYRFPKNIAHRKEAHTLMHVAAENGHLDVIHFLVKNKMDLDVASKEDGRTPLLNAIEGNQVEVVRTLLQNKANANKARNDGLTPLSMAAYMGYTHIIRILIEYGAETNADEDTPVFWGAQSGYAHTIYELAKNKADINRASKDEGSPIFIAAQEGHFEAVKALLILGADFNSSFTFSAQALKLLVSSYSKQSISRMNTFINQHSSEPTIKLLPRDIAFIMGHTKIVELIDQYAKKIKDKEAGKVRVSDLSFLSGSSMRINSSYSSTLCSSVGL